jgi:hypothetical protein
MSAVLPLPAAKRPSNSFLARLWRDKPLGTVGGVVLLLFVVVGVFAPWIAPYDYNEIAPLDRMQGPSWAHWFGTDNLGRDVLSRCIYGAQLSVIIGCSAAALATLISAVVGIVSGYFGGKVEGEGSGWSVRVGHQYADKAAVLDPADTVLGYLQIAGKPHIHSEFAWNKPNRYTADAMLLVASYGALRQMSLGVASMLARGENPALAASLVKDQGALVEQAMPDTAHALFGGQVVPGSTLDQAMRYTTLAVPSSFMRPRRRQACRPSAMAARVLGPKAL